MRALGMIVLALTVLSGCATTNSAAPNLINGRYYMAGDSDCVRYRTAAETQAIQCLNAEEQVTSYRQPMTLEEMQMYQMASAQQRASDEQFYNQLAAGNNALASVRYPQMASPQVTPLGNSQVRCLSTGFYTNCRRY